MLADGEFTPINRLRLLYEVIDSSRLVHTLTYRTRSQSLDTTRTVDLTVTLPDDITLTAAFTYDWNIQPPQVRFVNLTQLIRLPHALPPEQRRGHRLRRNGATRHRRGRLPRRRAAYHHHRPPGSHRHR